MWLNLSLACGISQVSLSHEAVNWAESEKGITLFLNITGILYILKKKTEGFKYICKNFYAKQLFIVLVMWCAPKRDFPQTQSLEKIIQIYILYNQDLMS